MIMIIIIIFFNWYKSKCRNYLSMHGRALRFSLPGGFKSFSMQLKQWTSNDGSSTRKSRWLFVECWHWTQAIAIDAVDKSLIAGFFVEIFAKWNLACKLISCLLINDCLQMIHAIANVPWSLFVVNNPAFVLRWRLWLLCSSKWRRKSASLFRIWWQCKQRFDVVALQCDNLCSERLSKLENSRSHILHFKLLPDDAIWMREWRSSWVREVNKAWQ